MDLPRSSLGVAGTLACTQLSHLCVGPLVGPKQAVGRAAVEREVVWRALQAGECARPDSRPHSRQGDLPWGTAAHATAQPVVGGLPAQVYAAYRRTTVCFSRAFLTGLCTAGILTTAERPPPACSNHVAAYFGCRCTGECNCTMRAAWSTPLLRRPGLRTRRRRRGGLRNLPLVPGALPLPPRHSSSSGPKAWRYSTPPVSNQLLTFRTWLFQPPGRLCESNRSSRGQGPILQPWSYRAPAR